MQKESVFQSREKQIVPTLQQIRRTYKTITLREVADAAGVSPGVEYLMEIGGSVREEDATKILAAFSYLCGKQYTFEQVKVNIADRRGFRRGRDD